MSLKYCDTCGNCANYFRRLVKAWYPEADKPMKRTHDEVVIEQRKSAEAVSVRREFYARQKAVKRKGY